LQRYERTRVLIEGDSRLARDIATQIERNYQIEVLDEPHDELVMIKVRESALNSLFYLGETLVSSCRVRLDDTIGHGVVMGTNHALAYDLALVDVVFSTEKEKDFAALWEERMRDEEKRVSLRRAEAARRIEKSRVDFSTMKVEV